ncbi:glucose-6-phosphate dehydrogenase [Cytobacillus gottheilii]|uniref:Glucose-6-phosphate 1-dehydrogenase n=1 Tax=Cytobacillus gottheilii TaxID=859144 RepID=A0ABX8FBU0_9BACI|nr:glucose-6-phosphate dehydrogenase [Cytobacillus gottheilii]QVY61509.1 glucose-6-phosphate dehydrogenase [Cytobacillus gottheilii]
MDSMTFVLFGATGDLAKRKIYPALFNLFLDQKLPKSFSVIGVGRNNCTDAEFQAKVKDSLYTFSRHLLNDVSKKQEFVKLFHYCQLDVTDPEGYHKLLKLTVKHEEEQKIAENRMFYLSVAPQFFDVIALNIKRSGLGTTNGWKRLIIEKPFGHDVSSAQALNEKLSRTFEEEEIFRIDHYLGKPMVQNLEAFVLANPLLKAIWNNQFISNVQITASETVGVENRAEYYDHTGAIRDMVQNHLLQLLMMTAMRIPEKKSSYDIRNGKREVMESIRPLTKEDAQAQIVRGQYLSGEIKGQPVVSYSEETGVQAQSKNDTFIAARVWIDHPYWKGVPFYIRTGKRMQEKITKIVVEFRNSSDLDSVEIENTKPNLLTISIFPNEGVSLQLNSKSLMSGKIEPINVHFSASQRDLPEAYERLLLDALSGDPTFFAHWEEVESSWKWIEPILEAFEEDFVPLHHYTSGSMGPDAAQQLLDEWGHRWW